MAKHLFKPLEPNDLGFGTSVSSGNQRIMNRDGSSNVEKRGLPFFRPYELYIRLITMPWGKFLFLVFLGYLASNFLFASLYVSLGKDALMGASTRDFWSEFQDAFFFSSQTISTLGFARISPSGLLPSAVAAIESLIGLLVFALATGLLYGRFSRPVAKILYSEWALIAPYRDITGLMFRIANLRSTELVDVQISATYTQIETHQGNKIRKFYPLQLERDKVSILSMTWTVVHPIDADSPLFKLTKADFDAASVEIIVMIKAFDDTFSQNVHSRSSYKPEEMIVGGRFIPATDHNSNGVVSINLAKISEYVLVNLPELPPELAKEKAGYEEKDVKEIQDDITATKAIPE